MTDENNETKEEVKPGEEIREMTAEEILDHAKSLAGAFLDQCNSHHIPPRIMAMTGAIVLCTMLKTKADVLRIIDTFTFAE